MPLGSSKTDIMPAVCEDPSSKVTKKVKTPATVHESEQMPELEEDTKHSNVDLEEAIEHLHAP
jgi:hypothetical protein